VYNFSISIFARTGTTQYSTRPTHEHKIPSKFRLPSFFYERLAKLFFKRQEAVLQTSGSCPVVRTVSLLHGNHWLRLILKRAQRPSRSCYVERPEELDRMNGSQPSRAPSDCWYCCHCGTLNLVANADVQCPACSHARCSDCKNSSDRFFGQQHLTRIDHAPSITETLLKSSATFPAAILSSSIVAYHYGPYQHPGSTPLIVVASSFGYDDLWHCNECNADNNDWLNFCPVCGASKP
jgi:hypothetical protein